MRGARAVVAVIAAGCLLATPLVPASKMAVAAAPGDGQRVAFTDDRDQLVTVAVDRVDQEPPTFAGGLPSTIEPGPDYRPAPRHEGEGSETNAVQAGHVLAYVSTVDDGAGEVYLRLDDDGKFGPPRRVTCENSAIETHPVFGPAGMIAYASNADGDWDIYVVRQAQPGPEDNTDGMCPGFVVEKVTNDPAAPPNHPTRRYDDMWPSWTTNGLVFSSTRFDPLADICVSVMADSGWGPLIRVTTSSAAETQPDATVLQNGRDGTEFDSTDEWIAFTTTEFRPDGSIAFVDLSGRPNLPGEPTVHPAWGRGVGQPQGSEPVWSGTDSPAQLAFTSTERDSLGGVWMADVADPQFQVFEVGQLPSLPPVAARESPVADVPGVAESHATWADAFDNGEDTKGRLVVTSGAAPPDTLTMPGRLVDADIGDVRSHGGSDRRVIVDETESDPKGITFRADETTPDYSPDGTVVFSSDFQPDDGDFGRRLTLSDSNGDNVRPVNYTRNDGDIDSEPAWSPDGKRIAFTRYRHKPPEPQPEPQPGPINLAATTVLPYDPPVVMVVTIDPSGSQATPKTVAEDSPGLGDENPSWSPDGLHIVLTKSIPILDIAARQPNASPETLQQLWVAKADGGDPGVPLENLNGDSVLGRSPDWSPDGTSIAYASRGSLRLISVRHDEEAWHVTASRELIGLTEADNRAVISSADDPVFSPDGSEIAFTGQPAGQPNLRGIYAISPEGEGLRLVTDERGPELEPAWSRQEGADVSVVTTIAGSPAASGAPVTATFTVTNLGATRATDVRLNTTFSPGGTKSASNPPADCNANGTGCSFGTMSPGETREYVVTLTYPSPRDGLATGALTSSSHDPEPSNDEDSEPFHIVSVDVSVDVAITGSPAAPGEPVTATFTVTNLGAARATEVRLATTFTPGGTKSASNPPPDCNANGTGCSFGTMWPGETREYVVTLTYPSPRDGLATGALTSSSHDPEPSNDEDSEPFHIVSVDVSVDVAITGTPAGPGEPVTVAFTVTNLGTAPATGVQLTTTFPPGGTRNSSSPSKGCDTNGNGCAFGTLAPGEVRGYVVTVTYPSARDGLATGAVTSTSDDSDQSNNEDSERFRIASADVRVDVRLVSEAPPLDASSGWVGGERRARIDVRNAGPDPADGVALTLSLPTDQMTSLSPDPCLSGIGPRCVIGALAKGEVRTFEVPVRMLKPGTALISAEVATTSTDSNPSNDNDAVSVRILQPTIRLLPAVARPGMVPMAFGENMPPGTNVKLRWDRGITVFQGPFRVAADGTMRTPLLIVRHDLLGSRAILATSTRNLFSEINGPMLVANRLSTPPDLRGRG